MEKVTGFSVLEEMEALRASRIEEGLVAVWLPADDVEFWASFKLASGTSDQSVNLVLAAREALEGRS